jgi:hypothetical protein
VGSESKCDAWNAVLVSLKLNPMPIPNFGVCTRAFAALLALDGERQCRLFELLIR